MSVSHLKRCPWRGNPENCQPACQPEATRIWAVRPLPCQKLQGLHKGKERRIWAEPRIPHPRETQRLNTSNIVSGALFVSSSRQDVALATRYLHGDNTLENTRQIWSNTPKYSAPFGLKSSHVACWLFCIVRVGCRFPR
jgi:hypothetical protein